MTDMRTVRIYKKAIEKWGEPSQLLMVMEELAELIQAISHLLRNKYKAESKVIEELADVEIMCEQLRIMINEDDKIDKIKEGKLARLSEMLEDK